MATPFAYIDPPDLNLIDKMSSDKRAEAAAVELNNLFASAPAVQAITQERVNEVLGRHRVSMAQATAMLDLLLRRYMWHCLADHKLSSEEVAVLKHLKDVLGITDANLKLIYQELVKEFYKQTVDYVLEDGKLDEDEHAFLMHIQNDLRLPPEIGAEILRERGRIGLEKAIAVATEDNMLSVDEETELRVMAQLLGIDIDADETTRENLERTAMYWTVFNDPLPPIPVRINLQRGESCYFVASVEWHEMRRVTQATGYTGPSMRIRLAKGLYWRTGAIKSRRITEDVMSHIDDGEVYITNKRILFMGRLGNKSIPLQSVLDVSPYSDGVEIEKATGKSPFLKTTARTDIMYLVITRLLMDSKQI